MIARLPNVLLALSAAAFVAAQNSTGTPRPTSTGGISACILTCSIASSKANGCSSVADIPCVCSSAQFQVDAALCLETNCSSEEVAAAHELQKQQCGAVSISPTGTAGPPKTLSVTVTRPSTTGSASASAPSSSTSAGAGDGKDEKEKSAADVIGQNAVWGAVVLGALVFGGAVV